MTNAPLAGRGQNWRQFCVLTVEASDTVLNGKSVIGSIVGTRADLADVFALHAAGRTRVIYETRPPESANDAS